MYFDAHGSLLFVSTQLCLAIHRSILDSGCLLIEAEWVQDQIVTSLGLPGFCA